MNKIVYPDFTVNQQDQRKAKKSKRELYSGSVVLSASGKTTIANALDQLLTQNKNHTYILDGDVFRGGLSSDLAFDKKVGKKIFDGFDMSQKCFVMLV